MGCALGIWETSRKEADYASRTLNGYKEGREVTQT